MSIEMRGLVVIGVMLLIVGSLALSLASNQQYMSDEGFAAYQDQKKFPPCQSANQQEFNFLSGWACLIFGLVAFTSIPLLRIIDK